MSKRRIFSALFAIAVVSVGIAAPLSPLEVQRFGEMRWQLFHQPSFKPYAVGILEKVLTDECKERWRNGKAEEAVLRCKEALRAYPTSILANRMLADLFQLVAQSPSATAAQREQLQSLEAKYRNDAEGFIASILASGDGKSPESAYKVITVSEEYMVIWFLGQAIQGRALELVGEQAFDVFEVRNREGQAARLYFDVTPLKAKGGG